MTGTRVEVESGQIVMRPSFADMLRCGQIPGGSWDTARRAWTFPATGQAAALIRQTVGSLHATPHFDALIFAAAAAEPPIPGHQHPFADIFVLPAHAAQPVVPDGLRTQPWRHQLAAFAFCLDRFARGRRGVLLNMWMGTGKSLVACMLVLATAAKRVLIACPLRVVPVWINQFERHVSTPLVITPLDEDAGGVTRKQQMAAEKMALAEARGVPFVAVINYDSAWREPFAGWAEGVQWDIVVADEQHRLKGPSGKASMFFKRLRM
jgi:hypothetical protein